MYKKLWTTLKTYLEYITFLKRRTRRLKRNRKHNMSKKHIRQYRQYRRYRQYRQYRQSRQYRQYRRYRRNHRVKSVRNPIIYWKYHTYHKSQRLHTQLNHSKMRYYQLKEKRKSRIWQLFPIIPFFTAYIRRSRHDIKKGYKVSSKKFINNHTLLNKPITSLMTSYYPRLRDMNPEFVKDKIIFVRSKRFNVQQKISFKFHSQQKNSSIFKSRFNLYNSKPLKYLYRSRKDHPGAIKTERRKKHYYIKKLRWHLLQSNVDRKDRWWKRREISHSTYIRRRRRIIIRRSRRSSRSRAIKVVKNLRLSFDYK